MNDCLMWQSVFFQNDLAKGKYRDRNPGTSFCLKIYLDFDLYLDTARQFKFHQSIDGL